MNEERSWGRRLRDGVTLVAQWVARILVVGLAIYGAWHLGLRIADTQPAADLGDASAVEPPDRSDGDEATDSARGAAENGDVASAPAPADSPQAPRLENPTLERPRLEPPRGSMADAPLTEIQPTRPPTDVPTTGEQIPAGTLPSDAADTPGAKADTNQRRQAQATTGVIADLRRRKLTIPVGGVSVSELHNDFTDPRSGGRTHRALDILAPRNHPVVAVEDGKIAKLFESKLGGLTIYQFSPKSKYSYYYAHLERYAEGLQQGAKVKRGQVIGYVGTSGNAPPDTPHLHFAIYELPPGKEWWKGEAVNPYPVFTGK